MFCRPVCCPSTPTTTVDYSGVNSSRGVTMDRGVNSFRGVPMDRGVNSARGVPMDRGAKITTQGTIVASL